jgi:hypothetical protein
MGRPSGRSHRSSGAHSTKVSNNQTENSYPPTPAARADLEVVQIATGCLMLRSRPLPHRRRLFRGRDHDIPVTLRSARIQAFANWAAVAGHRPGSIITTAASHGLTHRFVAQFANAKFQLDGTRKICDCFKPMAYQLIAWTKKCSPVLLGPSFSYRRSLS